MQDQERFWSKIEKKSNVNGCRNWIGGTLPNGYGSFYYNKRDHTAHRIAYHFAYNVPLDQLKIVQHLCNNRLCCEPTHLRNGSQKENLQYMSECGRSLIGTRNPISKLTDEIIIWINTIY